MSTLIWTCALTAIIGAVIIFFAYSDRYKNKEEHSFLVNYFKTHRKFITIKQPKNKMNQFRIMTYNILAPIEDYLQWNKYCPDKYLSWQYRLPRIIAQIIAYCPDIVCMQETSLEAFETNLKTEFSKLHYNSWHVQRGSERLIDTPEDASSLSACCDHSQAIFWKKSAFKCVHEHQKVLRFNQLCQQNRFEKYVGKQHDENKLYQKVKELNDCCMVLHLQHIESNKHLIVCNSHFFWDPEFNDVKLLQCMIMNVSLHDLVTNEWKLSMADVSIVFGVDSNSFPYDSGVYKLMTTGNVGKEHTDHPMKTVRLRNKENAEELTKQVNFVRDVGGFGNEEYGELKWKSAYNLNGEEPIYTNKSNIFEAALDYLFYFGEVEVLSYLEMPFSNALHMQEFDVETTR